MDGSFLTKGWLYEGTSDPEQTPMVFGLQSLVSWYPRLVPGAI
jgi:hypothetical protein